MLSRKLNMIFTTISNLHFNSYFRKITPILITYNLVPIFLAAILFYLIPYILNYPPGMIEGSFEAKWFGISYFSQFIIIMSLILITGNTCLILLIKDFNSLYTSKQLINPSSIEPIINKCLNLPFYIMILQCIIPSLFSMFILYLLCWNKTSLLSASKIVAMASLSFFVFSSILFVMLRAFSKKILKMVPQYNFHPKFKVNLKTKICLQFTPVLISAILFTSLLGYSQLVSEKGELLFQKYQNELNNALQNIQIINESELKKRLNKISLENIKGGYFLITPKGKVITYNSLKLSKIFLECARDLSARNNGMVSDLTGEIQGVVKFIKTNKGIWIVGLKYEVSSKKAILAYLFTFLILLTISIFFVYSLSKSLSDDITLIAQQFSKIIKGQEIDLNQKIAITSNDEIGDLIIAFNKILDLEKINLANSKELAIMKERKRFTRDVHDTLGQTTTNLVALLGMTRIFLRTCPDKAEQYLEKATDIATTGINEVKESITGVYTRGLTSESLIRALQTLSNQYQNTGVKIILLIKGSETNLSIKHSEVIYRICQEAITNAVRHGKASSIKITLEYQEEQIQLTIFDNGSGCQHLKKGNGLSGMEDRVNELNGSIIFDSSKQGFNIQVCLPLPVGLNSDQ